MQSIKHVATLALIATLIVGCSPFISNLTDRETVQGSNMLQIEERAVRDFSELSLAGIGDVIITQGENESLSIETDSNILPNILTEVVNGKLIISIKAGFNPQPTKLVYRLSVRSLTLIEMGGAGTISTEQFRADQLTLRMLGAGTFALNGLALEMLRVSMTGAGTVNLAGAATAQTIEISGAGTVNCEALEGKTGTVIISGQGNVSINVSDSLNVTISGIGDVTYSGSPSLTRSIRGMGSVNQR
ncbi:MAG: DUF2807 domain-containing protein [Chloroflexi bacterium CFX4]|nr:DUF2807 domain-containing protein [Chloroflexi bacterium CFX4]MDL1923519.1 DUF2807 domain-containing protein [Chloroflexi bacterium CFX3]